MTKSHMLWNMIVIFFFLSTIIGCEQYNPSFFRSILSTEQHSSLYPALELNEDGSLKEFKDPYSQNNQQQISPIEQKYQSFCASCHGAHGKADSATAMAMNPRPRNLTDQKWQASVDDAYIAKVIKLGGVAVGLSATMAPWQAVLNDQELEEMVALVRSLGQSK